MWLRLVALTGLVAGCAPVGGDGDLTAAVPVPGTALTVGQNYETAYRNVVAFARSCYEGTGDQVVQERLDADTNIGEIILVRAPNRPLGKVTIEKRDARTSVVTTRFTDAAWASHGPSFEAAAMGASAVCRAQ